MKTFMEKQERVGLDAWIEEILQDEEKVIEGIKNSPAVIRKNREAIEQLSKLKPPSPRGDDYPRKNG